MHPCIRLGDSIGTISGRRILSLWLSAGEFMINPALAFQNKKKDVVLLPWWQSHSNQCSLSDPRDFGVYGLLVLRS